MIWSFEYGLFSGWTCTQFSAHFEGNKLSHSTPFLQKQNQFKYEMQDCSLYSKFMWSMVKFMRKKSVIDYRSLSKEHKYIKIAIRKFLSILHQ